MVLCGGPNCYKAAGCRCSGCEKEKYCSAECQKIHWKSHKPLCPLLKKLSNYFRPYHEVSQVITETLLLGGLGGFLRGGVIRLLEHLLSYAEYQFGEKVTGKDYREREDGERIDNWTVDLNFLHEINKRLAETYRTNASLSNIVRDNLSFPYIEKSVKILTPMLLLNLDALHGNELLFELCGAEQNMAIITLSRNQFVIAEGHCKRSLDYSKRFNGNPKDRTEAIFQALKAYCALQTQQENYVAAVALSEEAYDLVVIFYDPAHPCTQEAAGILISSLTHKGDLYNACRFAEVTYSNLKDPKNKINQESEQVAFGAHNLADVLYKQGEDLVKAEELSRHALRIRMKIQRESQPVGMTCNLLANILKKLKKEGDEAKILLQRSLAIDIRHEGPDGVNTLYGHYNISALYLELADKQRTSEAKKIDLNLAKSHFEEALRIQSKIFGPNHPMTKRFVDKLADIVRTIRQTR
mmetsp:Transcript_3129/g.3277  ORF Transcript_3129/g.3277 Transcript_3129/m.3277 type:complete len:468 (+) Transcript_3129:190-1593(+)